MVGALLLALSACDSDRRNGYMLADDSGAEFGIQLNPLAANGYDWWWHSLVARNRRTGEQQPFFIEYFVVNPALGGSEPVLGQLPANRARGVRPSYAMIKAGTWAEGGSREINNFYGIDELAAAIDHMDVRIGSNIASDTRLVGSVTLSGEAAAAHPEYMSDAGSMSWDLSVEKELAYSVGYAASELFRDLNAFQMYWHVPGMKTKFSGTIVLDGEVFDVIADESYGYQDKNWGNDFTSPWIWLNCNHFTSRNTGEVLPLTSLDVGGGEPRAFGIPLGRKVLIAFFHEGELFEWNFTEELQKQDVRVTETEDELRWSIEAADLTHRIVIDFANPKSKMLHIDYENPRGERNHRRLWNGGHAAGTVKLYRRTLFGWKLIDIFDGTFGGAEYGVH